MIKSWKSLSGRLRRRLTILLLFVVLIIFLMIYSLMSGNHSKTVSAAGYDCYENMIAITFDDGPRRGTTDRLLDGLKERGVKATFFLVGKNIEGNEDIVARMHEDGHLIGNHTYSHIQLSEVSIDKAYDEIVKTNEKIASVTGETPKYIRPPYGTYSNKLLKRINMIPVLWSVDPDDWNTTDVNYVVRTVVSHAKCGDIILLHDFYDSSVTAALEIVDELQAKGYVFVTVDQILLD